MSRDAPTAPSDARRAGGAAGPDAPTGVAALVERGKGLAERWKASRPGRAMSRYGTANGALLCGGMAYSALFSLFAGLTIGYTVLMTVLGSRTELQEAVLDQVDSWVPGLIDTGEGGVLQPSELLLDSALTPASVVAVVVLLFSAISFMGALRSSVRAMFGVPPTQDSAVLAKVWGLVSFLLLAVSVVVTAATSVVVTSVGTTVVEALGGSPAVALLVQVLGVVVGVALDAVTMVLVVRYVGGVRVRRPRDLWVGGLLFGLVTGVLRYLGTSLVTGSASRNALLASFAVIVTLLVLVNFVARVLLMVCAWVADPPEPGDVAVRPDPRDVVEAIERTTQDRARAVREEARVRAGAGHGKPWSPVVRGVRRAAEPRR